MLVGFRIIVMETGCQVSCRNKYYMPKKGSICHELFKEKNISNELYQEN